MTPGSDAAGERGGDAVGELGGDGVGERGGRGAGVSGVAGADTGTRRGSPWVLAVLAVVFFVVFLGLGTWQVKRRAWKLDLIARVEQRVHAAATPAPGPSEWPRVTAATDEYRHVTASGTFLDDSQTLVQAVTDLGAGYWVVTPLWEPDGSVVLVNRGFVGADDRGRVQRGAVALDHAAVGAPANALPSGPAAAGPGEPTSTVTGLLRITEPGGAFLRHNNPAGNQWYSRDVAAIAEARGLSQVAPYFIDAQAVTPDAQAVAPADPAGTPPAPALVTPAPALVAPTPGLTVIHFHNSHLVYAITWYTLALMTAIAIPLGMRKQ